MTDDPRDAPERDDTGGPSTRPPAPEPIAAPVVPPAAAAVRQAPAAGTAGGMIRAAREAQGLDLATLAAMLKIPLKKLESLEMDRHDELPGATFERALAQAACRALNIDSRAVLALLPQNPANTLEHVTGGLNTPFRERTIGRGLDVGEASRMFRPVVLLPAVLALAAVGLFLMPDSLLHKLTQRFTQATEASPAAEAASGVATSTVALPAASAAAVPPAATSAPPGESVTPVDLGAANGGNATDAAHANGANGADDPAHAASGAVATTAAPAATPAAVAAPGAASAAPAGVAVVITASADSWVEIVDATGQVLISRVVQAGDSVGLDGAMPMKVKIGNARVTTLSLRGQGVDLTPWIKDNVARLQLK